MNKHNLFSVLLGLFELQTQADIFYKPDSTNKYDLLFILLAFIKLLFKPPGISPHRLARITPQ